MRPNINNKKTGTVRVSSTIVPPHVSSRIIPNLADPDSCCVRLSGTSVAEMYGGPMRYRRFGSAQTVAPMSQCLRRLVLLRLDARGADDLAPLFGLLGNE